MDNQPVYEYASFASRLIAIIIDGLIIGLFLLVLFFVLGIMMDAFPELFPEDFDNNTNPLAYLIIVPLALLAFIGPWLYFALQESSDKMATFGKRAMGIVVTNQHGGKINFWQATLRFFGKYLSNLILYIGYIMALFTERKQALHDLIANTLVMNTRPVYTESN